MIKIIQDDPIIFETSSQVPVFILFSSSCKNIDTL